MSIYIVRKMITFPENMHELILTIHLLKSLKVEND
jgi:hypothetical protein